MDVTPRLNKLQQEFCRSYEFCRNPVTPPTLMLKQLALGTLTLSDLELSSKETPAIMHFIRSKSALNSIHSLVLCRNHSESTKRLRGSSSGHETYSSFSLERAKLLKAVLTFVGSSIGLQTILIDSISLTPEVLKLLASALGFTSSSIRIFSIRNCPIGDSGFHLLFPGVAKLRAQLIFFESCRLTDVSVPYLCSLIKSQASLMDSMHWNRNLRNYPHDADFCWSEEAPGEAYSVHTAGLVGLSLSGNHITDHGIEVLGRTIRKNNWLLGINICGNGITDNGVCSMVRALSTNSQCVLQAILISNGSENNELSFAAHEAVCSLSAETTADRGRLELLPQTVSSVLSGWIEDQHKEYLRSSNLTDSIEAEACNEKETSFEISDNPVVSQNLSGGMDESLQFEFSGPPDVHNKSLLDTNTGIFMTAVENERPPSRISMRPRCNIDDDSLEFRRKRSLEVGDYLLPDFEQSDEKALHSGRLFSRALKHATLDRSLSLSLALQKRSSTTAARDARRSNSTTIKLSNNKEDFFPLAKRQSKNRSSRVDRKKMSGSLLQSTVASRASSFFYSVPPDRIIHGPSCMDDLVLSSDMRSMFDKLLSEGDKVRCIQKPHCKVCNNRNSPRHLKNKTRITVRGPCSTSPLSKENGVVVFPAAQKNRKDQDRSDDARSAKREGSRRIRRVKEKTTDFDRTVLTDVMLSVTKNLETVSGQLKDISHALSESINLSMSIQKNHQAAHSPSPRQQKKKGQLFNDILNNDRNTEAFVKDAYDIGGADFIIESSPNRRHQFEISSQDTEGNEKILNPIVNGFGEVKLTLDRQQDHGEITESISDLIRSSIKKNVVSLFSG